MNILQVLVLSLVEGVTEFLPVSSTYHLILSANLLGIAQNEFAKLFEVFIQSGAILSIVFLYGRTILKDTELMKKTILSFIPTAVIGFLMYKIIKNVFFESGFETTLIFICVGAVFLILEFLVLKKHVHLTKDLKSLSYRNAFLVGLIQSAAIIPGISRAGAVIVAMMILGYKRSESARYSFMLSIPTIFAASFYDVYKMRETVLNNLNNAGLLILGFAGAFVSSYIVVRWLIGYLQRNSLALFGWYRIVLGIIIIIFGSWP